jgi:hypothetical protein
MQHIVHEIPPLCRACGLLLLGGVERDHVAIATCGRCPEQYIRFLPGWLPSDEAFIEWYGDNVSFLMSEFGHTLEFSIQLARDYYFKFTDPSFCTSIGVPTQDEDFFWHEGRGLAWRMHYYLALKGDPDPHKFIEWRARRNRGARED